MLITVILGLLFSSLVSAREPTPIVIWHGMGDICCNPLSIGAIVEFLKKELTSVHVLSLQIGKNYEEDFINSFFMSIDKQVAMACDIIAQDYKLKNGFNLIGFSQGGLFVRAIVQMCPNVTVSNLITIGAPHQGVYGLPRCPNLHHSICNLIREKLVSEAYSEFAQTHLVQAQYWHDPLKNQKYINQSRFLADLNNEREPRNKTYKQNLLKLKKMVMIKFMNDTVLVPRESEFFGFYQLGQDTKVVPMKETKLYQEDWIGIKELDHTQRLDFIETQGEHLDFDLKWFNSTVINRYLR